jgi:hypothetical protein
MNGWLAQQAKLKWRHAQYARPGERNSYASMNSAGCLQSLQEAERNIINII